MDTALQKVETTELLSNTFSFVHRYRSYTPERYPVLRRFHKREDVIAFAMKNGLLHFKDELSKLSRRANQAAGGKYFETLRFIGLDKSMLSLQNREEREAIQNITITLLAMADAMGFTSGEIEGLPHVEENEIKHVLCEDISNFEEKLSNILRTWDSTDRYPEEELYSLMSNTLKMAKYWLDHTWAESFFREIHHSLAK